MPAKAGNGIFGAMLRDELVAAFARRYGVPPELIVRAPGRVNLIGEHVDYCGLAAFPMAIQRGVELAPRPRADARVRVSNLEPRFAPRTFGLSGDIGPGPAGDWSNYLRAAAQAVVRRYGLTRGFDGLVGSDLAIAAGLSSSSALVVATALALLAANDVAYEPLDLMELLAEGERYVGTAGGGMDQAISLGARAGCAARIDFRPLRLTHVPVPASWAFIVAWSMVSAEKSGAARRAYNERVQQTAAARDIVARHVGLGVGSTYAHLLAARPVEELLDAASVLPPVLRGRYRHVVSEGGRVADAVTAMERGDLDGFGRLMSASYASLRDDYEVSTPELDRLVDIARAAGAAGARLTGAGFGGCIVAVAEAGSAGEVLEALERGFYAPSGRTGVREGYLFVAQASEGATTMALG